MKQKTKIVSVTKIFLVALLLTLLAALHGGRALPEVPRFGKLLACIIQALENHGTRTSKAGN